MDQLLEKAKEEHARVVIDTPPVIPISDALIVGEKAGAAILVASSGATQKRAAARAAELFQHVTGLRILGAVLNRMAPGIKGGYYGYYYSHYSRYYGDRSS